MDGGRLGQVVFAEGLSNVVVRAAAPRKALVPSALGATRPSCALGLVLFVESPQHASVCCLGQDMSCSGRTVYVCGPNCFPGELQELRAEK